MIGFPHIVCGKANSIYINAERIFAGKLEKVVSHSYPGVFPRKAGEEIDISKHERRPP
jgi:hypothetical protein